MNRLQRPEIVIKKPTRKFPDSVALFAVVRNEMDILRHFLRHYRHLGVREFWFFDDHSEDGTTQFILDQQDCGLITSKWRYGRPMGNFRFGDALKNIIPTKFFRDRWLLSVDADEFLLLPTCVPTISDLIVILERRQYAVTRAIMLEFFPADLQNARVASAETDPFEASPYFDRLASIVWPAYKLTPDNASHPERVRNRIFKQLLVRNLVPEDIAKTRRVPSMNKVPLVRWREDVHLLNAHHVNIAANDDIQLILAHFKFHPGIEKKVKDALATKAYWQDSVEYRILDLAFEHLANWSLLDSNSGRFSSCLDLESAGLLYLR